MHETVPRVDTALKARLDAVIDRAIVERRIVGAVVLVSREGQAAYRRSAGFFDREAGVPMREDAIFRLASVTKPIVAATALAMMDAGKLGLDDMVTRWLPDFRPKLAGAPSPEIKIRHLLNHTAGLTYSHPVAGDAYFAAGISGGLDMPGRGMEENLRRLASVPLLFEPGTAWKYGMGIDVLGAIIARAGGPTLADAVARYVTGPLGMNDTAFAIREPGRLAVPYGDGKPEPMRMGEPHTVGDDPADATVFSPARILDESSFQSGGAGMAGTTGDFMKFLEAIRGGGAPILKRETVAMASRNQIGDLPREEKDAGLRFGFLSAVLADPAAANSPQSVGALEWGGAWGHSWFIDPAEALSVAAFTNTAMEGCNGPFTKEVRNAVYGDR